MASIKTRKENSITSQVVNVEYNINEKGIVNAQSSVSPTNKLKRKQRRATIVSLAVQNSEKQSTRGNKLHLQNLAIMGETSN